MKDKFIVKFASKEDIDSWMDLVETVKDNFPGLETESYKKFLAESIDKKTALLVKDHNATIGALLFSYQNNELCFLAVDQEYRKHGIAKALVSETIKQFPKDTQIIVTTFRENDSQGQAARSFYIRLGFTPAELIEEFGYPCQRFIYTQK